MLLILCALAILSTGGATALMFSGRPRSAGASGAATSVVAMVLAGWAGLDVLISGQTSTVNASWSLPLASFRMALDPLGALFVVPLALVGGLAAIYGRAYLAHGSHGAKIGRGWLWYNLLMASMLLVIVARNGVLFLMAWEAMSLASFFLVMYEDEHVATRQAGWTYLVATHLGTAFLLAMFTMLGRMAGSLDFDAWTAAPESASVIFLLALLGFGAKAGLVPLHVWLPEAHPAAPSHVSAVMSGVMIKMGIYGLLRTLAIIGPPAPWWGWTLLGLGAGSGLLGVLMAVAQHDLKRLLAYSSVENMGIVAMGLGLGLLGICYQSPATAALGLAGALVHVLNHAVFKSLLFLGAGSVAQATGTRRIDRLGGLLRRMPRSGVAFLIGAAAISGLPPLNGFVGELLIYVAAFAGVSGAATAEPASWTVLAVLAVGALSLIGGLAAACFTRAAGIVFLGEPRSAQATDAREVSWAMWLPMVLLAGTCGLLVVVAPLLPSALRPSLALLSHGWLSATSEAWITVRQVLCWAAAGSVALVAVGGLLAVVRWRLLAGRPVGQTGTWDCGYVAPSARMQYTGSSFAQPLVALFRLFLWRREAIRPPTGLFPEGASLETETPDGCIEGFYGPLFAGISWTLGRLRWLQQGRIQLYVLYIALTLLVLLLWKLG